MALTAMSTVTKVICEQRGHIAPVDMVTTGTDLKPGMCVTSTGETIRAKAIDIPGAADEITAGIVGCNPEHDIDTAYAAGVTVKVYPPGCGAKVWGWATAGDGDKVASSPLMHSHAGADGLLLSGELVNEYLGQAAEDTVVDATDDTPILVDLT